jgi:hypothetical protein
MYESVAVVLGHCLVNALVFEVHFIGVAPLEVRPLHGLLQIMVHKPGLLF